MKHFVAFLFVLITHVTLAQNNYLDNIAQDACNCIEKLDTTVKKEERTMQMGLCMINAAQPYQKQLKKDHKIDFNNIGEEGERLGYLVGMKMALFCPSTMVELATLTSDETTDSETEVEYFETFTGEITTIEDNEFVVFTLKDKSGTIMKFHWIWEISASETFTTTYKESKGKIAQFEYAKYQLFDATLKEYRTYLVVQSIQLL